MKTSMVKNIFSV